MSVLFFVLLLRFFVVYGGLCWEQELFLQQMRQPRKCRGPSNISFRLQIPPQFQNLSQGQKVRILVDEHSDAETFYIAEAGYLI